MAQCRYCKREQAWPCMATRDMEERPGDLVCDDQLMKLGGGERIVNQERAAKAVAR